MMSNITEHTNWECVIDSKTQWSYTTNHLLPLIYALRVLKVTRKELVQRKSFNSWSPSSCWEKSFLEIQLYETVLKLPSFLYREIDRFLNTSKNQWPDLICLVSKVQTWHMIMMNILSWIFPGHRWLQSFKLCQSQYKLWKLTDLQFQCWYEDIDHTRVL